MAILVPFLIPFSFSYCKEKKYNAFSEISILDAFPLGLEQSGNFHRKIRVGEPINRVNSGTSTLLIKQTQKNVCSGPPKSLIGPN